MWGNEYEKDEVCVHCGRGHLYGNVPGGQRDGNYYDIWQGWKAEIGFNLTAVGDQAILYNASGTQMATQSPTTDVTSFVPAAYNIVGAKLNFTFSSNDWPAEKVRIEAGVYDGNTLIYQHTYDLNPFWRWLDWGQRQYANLDLDLIALGSESMSVTGNS
jgi:hypothetical protein